MLFNKILLKKLLWLCILFIFVLLAIHFNWLGAKTMATDVKTTTHQLHQTLIELKNFNQPQHKDSTQ